MSKMLPPSSTPHSSTKLDEVKLPPIERSPSKSNGTHSHLPHAVDLLLDLKGPDRLAGFRVFAQAMNYLGRCIERGKFTKLNEKIDGSPSIVFGLDHEEKPYVAYKGGFQAKGEQILIRSIEELNERYDATRGFYPSLYEICEYLLPKLAQIKDTLQGLVIQADLLFTANNGAKQFIDDSWHLKPNTVRYQIKPTDRNFDAIGRAQIGLAIHTLAGKEVQHGDKKPRLRDLTLERQAGLGKIVRSIKDADIFAVHSWSHDIKISRACPPNFSARLSEKLFAIERTLAGLPDEFIAEWHKNQTTIQTFLNTGLQPRARGGIYRAAVAEEVFDDKKILEGIRSWAAGRVAKAKEDKVAALSKAEKNLHTLIQNYQAPFLELLRAYYEGLAVQALVQPYIDTSLTSVISGERNSEGFVFKSSEAGPIITSKIVNRLGFTARNNANWNRGDSAKERDTYESPNTLVAPFERWQPGLHIYLGKFQPPTLSHIRAINNLQRIYGDNLVVLASDKEVEHTEMRVLDIGLFKDKKELDTGIYRHPFSNDLRMKMLREGAKNTQIVVSIPRQSRGL